VSEIGVIVPPNRLGNRGAVLTKHLQLSVCVLAAICCASASAAPANRDALFTKYASAPVYHGPVQLPRFKDRDRDFADYRTRIRDGMRQGANFAGHYALIGWGCGTGCQVYVVGDVITGQMFDFLLSGEEFINLRIQAWPDSRLILASWAAETNTSGAGSRGYNCLSQRLQWNGIKAVPLGKPTVVRTVKFDDIDKCDGN